MPPHRWLSSFPLDFYSSVKPSLTCPAQTMMPSSELVNIQQNQNPHTCSLSYILVFSLYLHNKKGDRGITFVLVISHLKRQLFFFLQLSILRSNWAPACICFFSQTLAQHVEGSPTTASWGRAQACLISAKQARFSSFMFPEKSSCLLNIYFLLRTE